MIQIIYQLVILALVCFSHVQDVQGEKIKTYEKQKPLPAFVFGSVFCNKCLDKTWTLNTVVIENAIVTIDCGNFKATNITSKFGTFTFEVAAEVSTKLASCSVKVTDFSKVKGELSVCTNPATLELVTGDTSPSPSVPRAVLVGWPWYEVGPFVFQPAAALSTCKKVHAQNIELDRSLGGPPPYVHPRPPVQYPPPEVNYPTPVVHYPPPEPQSPPCPAAYAYRPPFVHPPP